VQLKQEVKSPYYANYKKQVNVSISPETYEGFKSKCASYGVSMTAVIIHTMLEFIDKPDGKLPADAEETWEDGAR
tara:strand:- start:170 stop:394 length:225 start_codon:yes stop_codon:yes gene_type:complete